MEIYFSQPDEDNVSDDISEALMRSVIRNLRAAITNPEDYTVRSNLMWDATMAENRIIKLGKGTDFECHKTEHQLDACGVDYFDFYLMHAQSADIFARFKSCRAYETALELKAEGKIRHFGISFHDRTVVLDRF